MQRVKEGQQETDRPERSHPRYETEKTVATVAENIRLGAREKSSVHNVEEHTSDLGGKVLRGGGGAGRQVGPKRRRY